MSRKAKYTVEQKVQAAERYIREKASASGIAAEMGMPSHGDARIREWAAIYREKGVEGFHLKNGNRSYTAAEMLQISPPDTQLLAVFVTRMLISVSAAA